MYSEADIEAAVAAGVLPPATAQAFRNHIAATRQTVLVDEESFRLLTGFNDIFVSIAITLLLVALAWIGSTFYLPLGGAFVAVASWGLAEYFTRKRRMALPSIILLLSFIGGVVATLICLMIVLEVDFGDRVNAIISAAIALAAAGCAMLHWLRFKVPITIAAGAASAAAVIIALILSIDRSIEAHLNWLILAGGVAIFAFAMWWDMSDRTRQTRRSDVAFWLHLTAAPMIAHAIFNQIGVTQGSATPVQAVGVVVLYIVFALISLAIDRRALLVSSLAYVLYAISALFREFGAVGLNVALTALVIGSALLLLSAFWHTARRMVVSMLPGDLQLKLPVLDHKMVNPQPAS